jgi:hypothetical protein
VVIHSTPESNVAAVTRRMPGIVEAAKERVARKLFK